MRNAWRWFTVFGLTSSLISCGNTKSQYTESPGHASDQPALDLSGGSDVATGDPLAKSVVSIQLLDIGGFSTCSGTMIAANWVMTAAHCVTNSSSGKVLPPVNLRVRFNEVNVQKNIGTAGFAVAQVVRHPTYSIQKDKNSALTQVIDDIALIRLAKPIPTAVPVYLSNISTERLEQKPYSEFYIGGSSNVLDIAGYGVSSLTEAKSIGILRKGRSAYGGVAVELGSKFIRGVFGSVASEGALSLPGDSGGPVFFPRELSGSRLIVAGVSSNGGGGFFNAEPAGEHQSWIQETVGAVQFASPDLLPPSDPTCQVQGYGQVFGGDYGKRFYRIQEKGLFNKSGVGLAGNIKGTVIIGVPVAKAKDFGVACYCFKGVHYNQTDPFPARWTVAEDMTACK